MLPWLIDDRIGYSRLRPQESVRSHARSRSSDVERDRQ